MPFCGPHCRFRFLVAVSPRHLSSTLAPAGSSHDPRLAGSYCFSLLSSPHFFFRLHAHRLSSSCRRDSEFPSVWTLFPRPLMGCLPISSLVFAPMFLLQEACVGWASWAASPSSLRITLFYFIKALLVPRIIFFIFKCACLWWLLPS